MEFFSGFATKMDHQGDGLGQRLEIFPMVHVALVKRMDHKVEEETLFAHPPNNLP